jgi:spore germination protein
MDLLPKQKIDLKFPLEEENSSVKAKFSYMIKTLKSFNHNFEKVVTQKLKEQFFQKLNLKNIPTVKRRYLTGIVLDVLCIVLLLVTGFQPAQRMIKPLIDPLQSLRPLSQDEARGGYEVFGFAPYWTFNKIDNVDFKTLTTLAYFDVEISSDGSLDKSGRGYEVFKSDHATQVFKKAHANGTRVVLTFTQMQNPAIRAFMDDRDAQARAINEMVKEVKDRGIDGINVDFEYMGNPGDGYRKKFTQFSTNLKAKLEQEVPNSKLSVSVYASAIKEPKIYNLADLSKVVDHVFMMAYDFGYAGSDQAIPTAPLYGYKTGQYWYDVSTAVNDFLTQMPANKLILGTPWYGYNYSLYGDPKVKAEVISGKAQTYATVQASISPQMENISAYKEGWDDAGKVSWKAYFSNVTETWKIIFIEDTKSLSYKYDFAKSKNLAGVGIWALGFDEGRPEMWALLRDSFGNKDLANNEVVNKAIISLP